MIRYLNLEQVLQLHDSMIEKFGGLSGIRDINLLISAIETPKSSVFGTELYPTLFDKASVYLYQIVQNHPFNDANKRTSFGCTYLFLKGNKCPIIFSDEDLEEIIILTAKGKLQKKEIAHFLEYGQNS